jgi:DNA-binding NtrC family response regulator
MGRFEAAEGGTIFLDEIGDMAAETQAKVLRVLQERSFERVGGTQPIAVDVRVIAATHRNLSEDVATRRFREDLYYRLKVVEIELPPLRERREDVPALALRFLEQVTERLGLEKKQLSDDSLARLARHGWPGNVRELHNVIEQAAVLSSGTTIEESDLNLGRDVPGESAGIGGLEGLAFADAKKRSVEQFERAFLLQALRREGGNISRAAESIGMVRQSLQQKIRELGLRSEDWGNEG